MPRKINATSDAPHWPAPQRLICGGLHRMAWRDLGRAAARLCMCS